MADPLPRLLVVMSADTEVRAALTAATPGVPWAFASETPVERRVEVEALLAGSQRFLLEFDPSTTPKLRFVQRIFTGLDDFPFDRFPETIPVAGNVGAFAPFVAEHAVALALATAREIVRAQTMVREGRLRPAPDIRLFKGATALILGYGEIGRAIARRLQGFDVRVIGVNRGGGVAPDGVKLFPANRLLEALPLADLLFDARPLTVETRGSIGAEALSRMRATAIYVNVGRAATADEEALYHHLVSHPSFRAAFDPWWDEDFVHGTFHARFPFSELPNFVGTPHSAGYGPSTLERAVQFALRNLAEFFAGRPPSFVVDRREYARPAAPIPEPPS